MTKYKDLQWCDFIVYTSKGLRVERIKFDQNHWDTLCEKLCDYYCVITTRKKLKMLKIEVGKYYHQNSNSCVPTENENVLEPANQNGKMDIKQKYRGLSEGTSL